MINDSPYEAMKRDRRKIRIALFDSSDTEREARPWCKCAGILNQRMLVQGDHFFCKLCGKTQPMKMKKEDRIHQALLVSEY